MKHLSFACFAALAAAAVLTAQDPTSAAPSSAAPIAAAPRTGTIDLIRIFEQNPKWTKSKAELEKMQDAFKAQIKKLSDRVQEIRALVESTDENSDDWRNGRFELEMTMKQRDYLSQQAAERLDLENSRAMLAVYQDIEVAVAQVAKARGIAIVLRSQAIGPVPGDIGKLTGKELQGRVVSYERKSLWYSAPELDLTDDLIKALMAPVGDDKQPKSGRAQEAAGKPADGVPPTTPKAGG